MKPVKAIKAIISLAGILLGLWLALGGLELRILGAYLPWHQQITLLSYPEHLFRFEGIEVGGVVSLAWPMAVFGSSWGGALIGFWIGESWSVPAMIFLSILALPFPYIGTILGFILLILLLTTPEIRQPAPDRINES